VLAADEHVNRIAEDMSRRGRVVDHRVHDHRCRIARIRRNLKIAVWVSRVTERETSRRHCR
jgi:hypothetical protein